MFQALRKSVVSDRDAHYFNWCESRAFGPLTMADETRDFYTQLNGQVMKLVRTLPEPLQTDAMIFMMGYSGLEMGEGLDLFRNYYLPMVDGVLDNGVPIRNKITYRRAIPAVTLRPCHGHAPAFP